MPEETITIKMPRGADALLDLVCPRIKDSAWFDLLDMLNKKLARYK